MSSQTVDYILRSRKTILSILAKRGYDTKPYEKFGYEEVEAMLKNTGRDDTGSKTIGRALRMDLKRSAESTDTGIVNCRVEYALSRLKAGGSSSGLESLLNMLQHGNADGLNEPKETKKSKAAAEAREDMSLIDKIDPATTEVIIMLTADNYPLSDSFHTKALTLWNTKKFRIGFFLVDNLVNNPAEHVLVPKHERVPLKEQEELLKQLYAQKKQQLPWIVFHVDIQARILGLIPGDIVKITRPSPSAGYYTEYRVCAP
jgi:DNA-directed RNA polymerase subunit H (RpoH/RPB5)